MAKDYVMIFRVGAEKNVVFVDFFGGNGPKGGHESIYPLTTMI